MENYANDSCSLGQELTAKVGELEALRLKRESQMVDFTLESIAQRVRSKKKDIEKMMAANKGDCQHQIREVVIREVKRCALGVLWCPAYEERAKSDQQVMAYTGSHWQRIEPQQWKDFVADCAERIGVPEPQLMNPAFMRQLFEAIAYNLAKFRRQCIPENEAWLNLSNGTLVVKKDGTVTLRKHNKDDLFRYTLPYNFDPKAGYQQWQLFLNRVLPEPDAQLLLAEFAGYCFMPHHRLERMLLLYGEGLNGKSVTLEVFEALLGTMNVSYLSLSDLTNDEVKRAAIEGKMLNISHESGKDVNPNVLKQLTSGERVLVKHLYHDPHETSDYGKLISAFNILPRAENSFGFFRRLLILPYSVTIPKEEIDRQLSSKLKSELAGILNWVLAALPGLMARGDFSPCASSERALEQYRLQSDNVRLFLSEMCEPSDSTTSGKNLFEAYRGYCFSSQLKPLGKTRFYDRLEALGHKPEMYANLKYFKLRLSEL